MANTYVNQVGLADGTILIDLTTDTALAADVLTGKYFHLASGQRVQGSCDYDSNTTDADALATEILNGKIAYVNKNKIVGSMTNNGAVNGVITTKSGTYTIPAGYHNGLGSVAIDSTEQAKLIASNIRSGVTILGVEGTMSGSESVKAGTANVTPYLTSQTVLPSSLYIHVAAGTEFEANKYYELDDGTYVLLSTKPADWDTDPTAYYEQCNYINQVNVAAITVTRSDNAAGGVTVTIGAVDPNAA